MTVSSNTNQVTFLGNGVTTVFSLPFRFFKNQDIKASLIDQDSGDVTPLSLGVDYTLFGAGEPEVDGNAVSQLTMTVAPATGSTLYVERVMDVDQPTDIINQGRFFPNIHENVFDRLTMLIQQGIGGLGKSLRVIPTEPPPAFLPVIAQRANRLLSFDDHGDPIAVAPASESAAELAMDLANATDPAKGAALVGYKGRTVSDALGDRISVWDYFVEGEPDATQMIQRALDANPGRRVYLPNLPEARPYIVSDTLWIKYDGTVLEGETNGGYTFPGPANSTDGTIIRWAGPAGGTAVKIARFESVSPPYSFSGGGIRNIQIDCEGATVAGVGLYIPDANNSVFEHIKIKGASSRGLDLSGFVPDVPGLNSVYNCAFRDLMITVSGSGDGIYMGETPNVGGGDHPAFVSFDNVHITYLNGIGINIFEGDDLSFNNVGISRAAGGGGDAIVLQGAGAHGNHFRCLNVTQTDGPAPKIWCKTGVRATYFEMAGIDKNIRPTIDPGAEVFYLYLGSNTLSNDAEFRSPVIRLPNIAKGEATYLDWYEEGTFTPSLLFGGASVGVTYNYRDGRYVRIGRTVFVTMALALTSKGTSVGTVSVGGLPWVSTASGLARAVAYVRPVSGFVAASVDRGCGLVVGSASTSATLLKNVAGSGGMSAMTETDLTNTAEFQVSFNYEV